MEADNRETLKKMLEEKLFTRNIVFGTFGEPGYEEAWGQDGIKVDLLSVLKHCGERDSHNRDVGWREQVLLHLPDGGG